MKPLLFFLLLLLTLGGSAQSTISGKIIAKTGEPLAGTSIFFNNTTIGTTSKSDGSFLLNDIPAGKQELVVSNIGYQSIVYPLEKAKLPVVITFKLEPKIVDLDTVIVKAPQKFTDTWEKWGTVFTETFLGSTPNAQECNLKNKEELSDSAMMQRKTC